jgi:hypothetical protein
MVEIDDLDKSASFLVGATARRSTSSLGFHSGSDTMIRCSSKLAGPIALFLCGICFAETPEEIRTRVLTQTKVVYTTDLRVPVAEYKGDGDPMTLEIVDLGDSEQSRVSDDGEVIFLSKPDAGRKPILDRLFKRAFELRIARALGGT